MIGSKIKSFRKRKALTLNELSKRTGLSIGCLSNIERGVTSPTYDNLCSIASAMGTSTIDIINNSSSFEPYIRKSDRQALYANDYRFHYEYTTDHSLPMTGICMSIPETYFGTEVSTGHETDEYGIIVNGSLCFEVDGETYIMEEGDSIYIRAGQSHSWRKLNEGVCISYWTRINFDMKPFIHYQDLFTKGLDVHFDKTEPKE